MAPPLIVIWVTVTARTLRHCAQTGMGFRGAESCTLRRTNGHLTSSPIALSSTLSSWRLFQVVLWPPLSPILPICGMSRLKRSPKICVPDRTATCRGEYSIGAAAALNPLGAIVQPAKPRSPAEAPGSEHGAVRGADTLWQEADALAIEPLAPAFPDPGPCGHKKPAAVEIPLA